MSMPRYAFFLLVTLFAISLAMAASAAPPNNPPDSSAKLAQYVAQGYDYVPDQLLVKFKPGTRASEKASIHKKLKGKKLRESPYGAFTVVELEKGANVHAKAKAYGKYKKVAYAEPNYIRQASFVPNDPEYSKQWHLYNAVNTGLNVQAAWDVTMGDPSVKVAVLDTGVAYENYDEDGDGFYDYLQAPDLAGTTFWKGRDFANGDAHPNDDDGHGTHVTGTIAQSTNNSLGCAGVAPNVTIIPVKVLGQYGGYDEWIANGIYYAAYLGADVINMSLGGDYPSNVLRDACWFAYTSGVTIVAAAGNSAWEYIGYPAGYDESVIAVGATDYENNLSWYSSYGESMDAYWYWEPYTALGLDVVAPGGDTSADLNLDGNPDGVLQQTLYLGDPLTFIYDWYQGTSMASPHVAGVAALIISQGVTDPDDVRAILEQTATDLGDSGYDIYYGWGLVNAEAAVIAAAGDPSNAVNLGPTAEAGANQTLTDSDSNGYESVTLDGSGSTADGGHSIVTYQWKENGILLALGETPTLNIAVGTHVLALTCIDDEGLSDTDTVIITINPGPPIVRVLGIDIVTIKLGWRYGFASIVSITDAQNQPVVGARVSGKWSGSYTNTPAPQYTNSDGQALFTGRILLPGTYTFTVTGVSKSGYTYRPDLNVETSETRTFYGRR